MVIVFPSNEADRAAPKGSATANAAIATINARLLFIMFLLVLAVSSPVPEPRRRRLGDHNIKARSAWPYHQAINRSDGFPPPRSTRFTASFILAPLTHLRCFAGAFAPGLQPRQQERQENGEDGKRDQRDGDHAPHEDRGIAAGERD